MARLEDAWGAPKDRTPAQFVGMAREWFLQLSRFGEKTVEQAITHVIGTHKYGWASVLPEIVMFCTRDDREWRDIVELKTPALPAPSEKFERDGRTTEEEIAFREQEIAAIKKNTGYRSGDQVELEEFLKREKTPASQDQTVSHALLDSKIVRQMRARRAASSNTLANQSSESPAGVGDSDDLQGGQS